MKETVYIIGAGVNQVITDWDGHSPPLLNNFFNIALKKRKFSENYYSMQIMDIYDYIEKHFKKAKNELADFPFDLELCFTYLERTIQKAKQNKNMKKVEELVNVQIHLESFVAEVLSDFEHFAAISHTMRNLGKIIVYEQPTIITFNYDCILEAVLENSYGVNLSIPQYFKDHHHFKDEEVPDEALDYSHYKWNRPLGYGFIFDEIQLQQAGISKFVSGNRFYSIHQNKIYPKPLLKLHGSLNWFRYLPIRKYPPWPGETVPPLGKKESEIILKNGTWWFARPPDHNGWLIRPVVITPVLYKDEYYNEKPFREIWEHAYALYSSSLNM